MKIGKIIALMTVLAVLTGCADREDPAVVVGDSPVTVSLAFSMPDIAPAMTRMADSVVQTSHNNFRGLKDVRIIPFKVAATVTRDHLPFVYDAVGGDEAGRVPGKPAELTPSAFYYYPDCPFWSGTASVLFYGRGANTVKVGGSVVPASDKTYYGSTTSTYMEANSPAQIQFSPEQISQSATPGPTAYALADYMTSIVHTPGWAASEDPKLRALYQNITRQNDQGDYALIGGSSTCVRAFMEDLYAEVGKAEASASSTLVADIRAHILAGAVVDNEGHLTLTSWSGTPLTDYPAQQGLPDGSVAMRWDGSAFVPQTQTTVETAITSPDRFVYPAELCYYGNSTILTSSDEVDGSVYQHATTWNEVLGHYTNGTKVTSVTKSAAMVSPVQYGVGRLCIRLKEIIATPFPDAGGELVSFDNTYYPLTAVIVGGQYPVGFDFRPETVQPWPTADEDSHAMTDKMLFVYDSQVKTNKTTAANGDTYDYYCLSNDGDVGCTNTLVLQSYEKKNVNIVLEFENRSDKKFLGHDGIVYPGTKFYLIGEVNPTTATENKTDENKNRVFTQDYTTTFDIQVENFKHAYNVMPDLLAPRMEIGVKVANWETIRPTTVELLNTSGD